MGYVRKAWGKITGKTKMEEAMNKPVIPPAASVTVSDKPEAEDTTGETESGKTAVKRKGKKSLKIDRSASGASGINV